MSEELPELPPRFVWWPTIQNIFHRRDFRVYAQDTWRMGERQREEWVATVVPQIANTHKIDVWKGGDNGQWVTMGRGLTKEEDLHTLAMLIHLGEAEFVWYEGQDKT